MKSLTWQNYGQYFVAQKLIKIVKLKCCGIKVVYYCLIQMNIINLGILAHIDAGKTSVTENLLFASGATEKWAQFENLGELVKNGSV